MKKYHIIYLYLTFFLLAFTSASAQNQMLRQDPYWVVESNLKTPKHSIIYFYNADNSLMYKQTVSGKKINVNRPGVRGKLDEMLKEVMLAHHSNKYKDSIVIANRF